jgi:hypothetical protein
MGLCLLRLLPTSFLAVTDQLVAAMMMLSVWILLRKPKAAVEACFLAGVCAGATYLLKTSGLFIIVGMACSLLALNITQERLEKRLVKTAVFAGGVLLVTLPWFLWQRHSGLGLKSISYLQMAAHFFLEESDTLGTTRRQAAQMFGSFRDVLLHDPARLVKQYLNDVFIVYIARLASQALKFPAYLFAGAGLLFLCRDLTPRRAAYLLICALVYLALNLVDFQLRLFVFLFPFLFLCVAYCLFREGGPGSGRMPWLKVQAGWGVAAALALYLGVDAIRQTRATIWSEPRHLLEAAKAVKQRATGPGDLIISRQTHLGYLSDLPVLFPLAGPDDNYFHRVRELRARFLVYSDRDARKWPGLRVLSDPERVPEGLQLIYRHKPSNTLVYEVVSPPEP